MNKGCDLLLTRGLRVGLCVERLPDARWKLGDEWFQGSRRSVLGSRDWKRTDDAPGPQELGHLCCS